MLTKDIQDYILSLKPNMLNRDVMFDLFNKTIERDIKTGKPISIKPPKVYPWESMTVHKDTIANLDHDVKSTVGLFIFNMYFLADCFGNNIPYINEPVDGDRIKKIANAIVNLILEDKVTTKDYAKYQERIVWLNNFTEILIPGYSLNLLAPSAKIKSLKAKLISDNKDIIANNDQIGYVNKIEKPLLAAAAKDLENDPGWPLFSVGGKPSFKNNYKNMILGVGPILDIVSGKYVIATNSYAEGIPPDQYNLYANSAIFGAFSRGVGTQYGGSKTKDLFAALQSVYLDEPGYDCHTPFTEKVLIGDESEAKSNMWSYIRTPQGEILITPENYKEYIGKTVAMRSPMFCLSDNICNKCAGDLFRRIGITNIGPATTKITSTFLNLSLKKMHDSTIKTKEINPFDYIEFIS